MLVASACSFRPTPQVATSTTASFTPTKTVTPTSTATPTKQLLPSSTATLQKTPTAASTPTVTPTPMTGITRIAVDPEKVCLTAFWSEDGSLLYYATARYRGERPVYWHAYSLATNLAVSTTSPLNYDEAVWARLGVTDLLTRTAYPELRGYVSPSGQRAIYTRTQGEYFALTPPPKTEIWIASTDARYKVKVMERQYLFGIYQAAWFNNENEVLIQFGYEGPADFLVVDFQSGTTTELPIATDMSWALSPGGEWLALMRAYESPFELFSLQTGSWKTIDTWAIAPAWSSDSRWVYYWWGSSLNPGDASEIRACEVATGKIATLVNTANLGVDFNATGMDFAVSPQRTHLAVCSTPLWLVNLKNP